MRQAGIAVLVALALIAASCGDDDTETGSENTTAEDTSDDTEEAEPEPEATGPADDGDDAPAEPETSDPETAEPETTDPPAEESAPEPDPEPVDPGFVASIDDPLYVDLLLDCWYGENEAGSCEQLEAAGLTADDAYGLGNSLSQTPDVFLREDCVAGDALSCAELNSLVQFTAAEGAADPTLMCLFWSAAREGVGDPVDFFHLETLLGADAPAGVIDGLARLEADPSDADAFDNTTGYLDPICAAYLD